MIFPKLYETVASSYKRQYNIVALGSYVKNAKRMHVPCKKSPKDHFALFNAKGFCFLKGEVGFEVKYIYTDNKSSCPLPKRTSLYLNSISDVAAALKEQEPIVKVFVKDGRNNLENLWA